MAGFKFTLRSVESAVCPPDKKDVLFFDTTTRGFGLRVSSSGGKMFLAQYSVGKAKRRVPLGAFGVLTIEEARAQARAVLGEAAKGGDPMAERKAMKKAELVAAADASFTFETLATSWAEAREGERRESYLNEAKAALLRAFPDWRKQPASSITVADAVKALDAIREAKSVVTANRALAYARAAYGWAVKRQKLTINPFQGLERLGREQSRERVLTVTELRAIWEACGKITPTLGAYVRVLMLTLQRREEVASMRWAELDDLENPTTWTLPRERAKNGRTHVVHLSAPVREIIRALPRIEGNPFVFAGRAKGSIGAYSYAKNAIEKEMAEQKITLTDWRLHDFRRSGVTWLATHGVPPHVADRILNHVSGTISGVAAVYQRAEFLTERRDALDLWAGAVVQ
ncbi:integrase [Gluconacetobacter johannae DSM 13595]|uniref:Tyrosine-type recombinase/integrase n=2 Tax=Gluconacetobacter johannae TaxID=112140 RepID=A0A7W4P4F7_9PROT|nr:tyrosine-type recombinase/integrase [Gluconacetobacter johannae]GBQ82343.1 integrase [Gluconacetobacter johannae DSM 13595]